MNKVVKAVAAVGFIAFGVLTGGAVFLPGTALAFTVGSSTFVLVGLGIAASLLAPRPGARRDRAASQAQLQIGEQPRAAVLGKVAIAGTLVDAFNWGGEFGTDWEVLVIALADHRCDGLEGILVDDAFHAFSGDGAVAGFNGQLEVYFRDGRWDQAASAYLVANGPGWTANDRGRGICDVVVAYKADDPESENPVWPGGRPRFRFVLRGARCYQARKDSTVGGDGLHRRDDPETWEWSENLIDCRYNWVRGFYAGDRVDEPEMLLVGRGLTELEAPPENVFARANLCDELVNGEPRYTIGTQVLSTESYLAVEEEFATACAGVIVQPQGSVEIDPGEPKSVVATFTDADLVSKTTVRWSDYLSVRDDGWINTVVASFVDPDQNWLERPGAVIRREQADIIADGGPREVQLGLPMVTRIGQSSRVAEITRRLGRLLGRGQVTLPPRYAGLEEGDWVNWTSNRRFGGGTRTFRVDAWQSDEGWRHTLQLREISAAAYSDGSAPVDQAVAVQQTPPPALSAPGASAWSAAGMSVTGANGSIPAVQITGAIDSARATTIRVDYRVDGTTEWTRHSDVGRDATSITITAVADQTAYEVSIRYLVDGVATPRRVLGPVTTGAISASVGTFDQAALADILARLETVEDNQNPAP
jgi:hypothetical protein